MLTTNIRFPVESIRSLSTHLDDGVQGNYIIVVNAKEIAHQFDDWRMPELRDLDVTDTTSQAIRKTLHDEPHEFFHRNRGITLLASQVSYDNRQDAKIVTIEVASPALHGLVDGGHTYQIICNYMDELNEEAKRNYTAYVRLEVLVGVTDNDFIQELIFARNFSAMRLVN